MNKLKLLGGAEPEKTTEKVNEEPLQTNRKQAKKRERRSDDCESNLEEDVLTLRQKKPKPKEVPDPQRKNTNQHPQCMSLHASQEEVDELKNNKLAAVSAEATITSAVVRGTKNGHPLRDSTVFDGERGVETRWSIDSDLHSEKICSERERERDKARPEKAVEKQNLSQLNANHGTETQNLHVGNNGREGVDSSIGASAISRWKTIPKPDRIFEAPATLLSTTPEAVEVENTPKLSDNLHALEQKTTAEKIDMNADVQMKEPKATTKATKDKLDESYYELEKWKRTTTVKLRSLKIELFEDTQLWRQNIATTTVQTIVDSLEQSLVGVFADVENLKTTARELFKMIQKQAEVMQLLCDKALSDKEAKQLYRELKQIWPEYSEKSPTPACFREASPTTIAPPDQATAMELEGGSLKTTLLIGIPNQEMKKGAAPWSATESLKSNPSFTNKTYDVSNDIRRRIRRHHDKEVAPRLYNSEDHFDYLRKCWHEQIDLPLLQRQKKNIWSFKNALIATGYDRVVLTWQGMFYEVSEEDIAPGNLIKKGATDAGVSKWVSEVVTVFR